jgi:uncharacterized membrane protein
MDTLTTAITINRPAEEIFGWLSDFANHIQWQPNLVEAQVTSPGPLGVGARYRYVSEVMGRRYPSTGEITAYEPNHIWAQRSLDGPAPVEIIYKFEPGQRSTKISVTIKTPTGGFPNAGDYVKRQLMKSLEEQNARLKQILESQSSILPLSKNQI